MTKFLKMLFLVKVLLFPGVVLGSDEAMMALFEILHQRGSISDEEYDTLKKLAEKGSGNDGEEKISEVEEIADAAIAESDFGQDKIDGRKDLTRVEDMAVPTTDRVGSGSGDYLREPGVGSGSSDLIRGLGSRLDSLEERLSEDEERIFKLEKDFRIFDDTSAELDRDSVGGPWYKRFRVDGYVQLRQTWGIDGEADFLNVPADRSVNRDESLFLRRGRFKFSGDISERIFFYSQFDTFASVFGSGGSLGLQTRDVYIDLGLDESHEYRFRFGKSKVPYGWVNMQSSQNRAPMERPEGLNSAVEGERDIGVYFMYTPVEVRRRLKDLVASGLKGSGDYGMFTIGAYNGQGLNRSDRNGELHGLVRLTYPWLFENGQYFETSIAAYSGRFVSGLSPLSDGINQWTPGAAPDGVRDQRVALTAIYFPQPFGIEAEWTLGRGPALSSDFQSIESASLYGGYILANYRFENDYGKWFPFVRWNYYDGARKFANNAPPSLVNELDIGFEWLPWKELEFTLMYTHTFDRNDTRVFPYQNVRGANRFAAQVQWNY